MDKNLYDLMDWAAIEEITYSECDRPKKILGSHRVDGGFLVQAFIPSAKEMALLIDGNKNPVAMQCMDEAGFFACFVGRKQEFKYKFIVKYDNEVEQTISDPYSFDSIYSEEDLSKFDAGINYEIYEKMGAKPMTISGVEGVNFSVWAPEAMRVSVVGDFNLWDGRRHQMERLGDFGVFEIFIPGVSVGSLYKFEIKTKKGEPMLKSDPYAFYSELRPNTASIVADISGFEWSDEDWMKDRENIQSTKINESAAMNIYELHLGSWIRKEMQYDENGEEVNGSVFYNYREIAHKLSVYVKKMNYTHVEIMPVMEHPLDASWGYQVTGYYSPTSRYGTPDDFMYFINYLHKKGIGVRMDAVASMLYLDYGKNSGEWVANIYGGNENLDAIEFLKHLNSIYKKKNPSSLLIAEESTAWPKVSGDLNEGGLGFDYKWNMGWMNDFLEFMKLDPYFRSGDYNALTFSLFYHYSENFILVLSHDEVVHGKATLAGKMPGATQEEKFANLRAAYGYMMTHPGKKLLFMGQEFGQMNEWNENVSLEWNLLDYDIHSKMQKYSKALNKLYLDYPALYKLDYNPDGFEWINCTSKDESTVVFLRKTENEEDTLVVVCNFTPVVYEREIGVPYKGTYTEIFNSDDKKYGGSGVGNKRAKKSVKKKVDGRENSLKIKVPPMATIIFKWAK